MRILDRQAGLRRDAEDLGGLEERIGMRLVARVVAVRGDAAESPGQSMALQMALDGGPRRAGRDRARQAEFVEQVEQFQHAGFQDLLRVGELAEDAAGNLRQLVDREIGAVMVEQLLANDRPGRADGAAEELGGHGDADLARSGQRRPLVQGLGVEQHAVHVEHDGGHGSGKRHGRQHLRFTARTQQP